MGRSNANSLGRSARIVGAALATADERVDFFFILKC